MNKIEKCKLALSKGCKYEPTTGKVFSVWGGEITNINTSGYVNMVLCDNGKRYYLRAHHFAYFWVNGEFDGELDHINGVKHDNRITNLRIATTQQNAFNRTKAKGYYWNKARNKWVAQIKIEGKSKHLGSFNTEGEARQCYLENKAVFHLI